MTLNAFKDGLTVLNEDNMNALLSLQDFSLIYDGTQRDGKTGSGVAEFDCASYDHAIRFTATGTTEVSRLELELAKDGTGADLAVEIRSGFNSGGSTEGTLLKRMVVPKEFIPDSRSYWSIPLDRAGLTSGSQYWIIVRRVGDAVNHFHLHGETAQDASYPCYQRAGSSGAWTAENAIHFKIFSGASGELQHGIYGINGYTTVIYSGETVSKVYRYLPPADGTAGGIRDIQKYTWSGEYLTKGVMA